MSKKIYGQLIKAKRSFEPLLKNVEGHGYKYVDLTQVIKAIEKPLLDNGLWFRQEVVCNMDNKSLAFQTILFNEEGEEIQSAWLHVPVEKPQGRNTSIYQTFGIAITYMKRYQLCSFFGMNGEVDTDGI